MQFEKLRRQVCEANMAIVDAGLVMLTWGNASGVDREAGVMAIKPSGVDYRSLTPADIALVSLETGQAVDGELHPSSDSPSHLALYRGFGSIGGIVHTHSTYATSWAQACREIPCLGTTHADCFRGPVPLTRQLTQEEIEGDYELNAGKVILERFAQPALSPEEVPVVLLPAHGPFVWGPDVQSAVHNAIVLEEVAKTALQAILLNEGAGQIPQALLDRHFLRKHGPGAYYGQRGG